MDNLTNFPLQTASKKIRNDKEIPSSLLSKTSLLQEYQTQQALHPHSKKKKQAKRIRVKSQKDVNFHTADENDGDYEENDISLTSQYDDQSSDAKINKAKQVRLLKCLFYLCIHFFCF